MGSCCGTETIREEDLKAIKQGKTREGTGRARIAQISCGSDWSGIQGEINKIAETVNAEVVFPEVEMEELERAAEEFNFYVASPGLKLMLARAKAIVEGRCKCDGIFISTCFRCAEGALVKRVISKYLHDKITLPVLSYAHTEMTKSGALLLRLEALSNLITRKDILSATKQRGISAGIDSGSSMTKAVVMKDNAVVGSSWMPSSDIAATGLKTLDAALEAAHLIRSDLKAIGLTGYGRIAISKVLEAQLVQEEVTVCAKGAAYLADRLQGDVTVVDIGGMDNKATVVHNGMPMNFTTGGICAGACGRFLELTAKRIGVEISKFGEFASQGQFGKVNLNAYCILFGIQDVVNAMSLGADPHDVAAAACYSVAEQVFQQQFTEIDIYEPVLFVGGSSLLKGLVDSMGLVVDTKVVVPPHSQFIGSIGAALLSSNMV